MKAYIVDLSEDDYEFPRTFTIKVFLTKKSAKDFVKKLNTLVAELAEIRDGLIGKGEWHHCLKYGDGFLEMPKAKELLDIDATIFEEDLDLSYAVYGWYETDLEI